MVIEISNFEFIWNLVLVIWIFTRMAKPDIQDTKVICAKVDENYPRTAPGCIGCPLRKSDTESRLPEAP